MVMMRISTAVDRRLGFGYDSPTYSNRAPEFTNEIRKLSCRLGAFRQKQLKKAVELELAELKFWLSELNRPNIKFKTAMKLVQRIRSIQAGLPEKNQLVGLEDTFVSTIRKKAIILAKAKLVELKKLAATDGYHFDKGREEFRHFTYAQGVSLEDLGYSKIQFHHLNRQGLATWEVYRKAIREEREARRSAA